MAAEPSAETTHQSRFPQIAQGSSRETGTHFVSALIEISSVMRAAAARTTSAPGCALKSLEVDCVGVNCVYNS
jgi:hypothetical protein